MSCQKGMVGCRRDCGHRMKVMEYRLARHSAELQREQETAGYETEMSQYGGIITFKEWLLATESDRSNPC